MREGRRRKTRKQRFHHREPNRFVLAEDAGSAEFLAEAEKANLDIAPKSAEVVAKLIDKMYASPAHIVQLVTKALRSQP